MELIDEFEKLRYKNKQDRVAIHEKKIAVHLDYIPIGWASNMNVQCNSKPRHTLPLTTGNTVWMNKKRSK